MISLLSFVILYIFKPSSSFLHGAKHQADYEIIVFKDSTKFSKEYPNLNRTWILPKDLENCPSYPLWTISSLPIFIDQKAFESHFWIYGTFEVRHARVHFLGTIAFQFSLVVN